MYKYVLARYISFNRGMKYHFVSNTNTKVVNTRWKLWLLSDYFWHIKVWLTLVLLAINYQHILLFAKMIQVLANQLQYKIRLKKIKMLIQVDLGAAWARLWHQLVLEGNKEYFWLFIYFVFINSNQSFTWHKSDTVTYSYTFTYN